MPAYQLSTRKLGRSNPVSLFESYLRHMVRCRRAERYSDTAIIFSVRIPPVTKTSANPKRAPTIATPKGIAREDRYVQFAFRKDGFYIDLPNCTLGSAEARRLLSQRPGFYRLRKRRPPWMDKREWSDTVRDFDAVQREYASTETIAAAKDMAFILFDLWRFPRDWPFFHFQRFVFSCRKHREWEDEGPLELSAHSDLAIPRKARGTAQQ